MFGVAVLASVFSAVGALRHAGGLRQRPRRRPSGSARRRSASATFAAIAIPPKQDVVPDSVSYLPGESTPTSIVNPSGRTTAHTAGIVNQPALIPVRIDDEPDEAVG